MKEISGITASARERGEFPASPEVAWLDPLADERWRDFVSGRDGATPFHTREWMAVLADTYGFRFSAVCGLSGSGRITSGVPLAEVRGLTGRRRQICLPFTDRCGPLGDAGEFEEVIWPALVRRWQAAGIVSAEIRDDRSSRSPEWIGHRLSLAPGPGGLFDNLAPSCRRAIRKAEAHGLRVEIGWEEAWMNDFFRLHELTRRRLGVPVQPRRFFDAIARHCLSSGGGWMVLVRAGEKPVSAGLFLGNERQAVYKFGASHPGSLDLRPNNLMIWKAILHAFETGRGVFDFGRTDPGHGGLRRFKSGWGAREFEFGRHRWPEAEPVRAGKGSLRRLASPLIRLSPLPLARFLGERCYRFLS